VQARVWARCRMVQRSWFPQVESETCCNGRSETVEAMPCRTGRFRAKREQLKPLEIIEPESQGQNLALIVLYGAHSLDSGGSKPASQCGRSRGKGWRRAGSRSPSPLRVPAIKTINHERSVIKTMSHRRMASSKEEIRRIESSKGQIRRTATSKN